MSTTGVRVVIDTNIFITIIGKKSPYRWIFDKIIRGDLLLCISNDIIYEYQEVIAEKTNREIAQNITDFLVIHPFVIQIGIFYKWKLISTDDDDNKFVDCAISADAYIISNDIHLQEAKKSEFPVVNVLTLKEFEKEFK